jgi:hypothetical protein
MPLVGNPADWAATTKQGAVRDAFNGTLIHPHAAKACGACDAVWRELVPSLGVAPLVFRSRENGRMVDLPRGKERSRRLRNFVYEVAAHANDVQAWTAGEPSEPEIVAPEPDPTPEPPAPSEAAPRFHHAVSEYVAALVQAGIPVWLHGPAGTGKSSAAKYAADKAGLDYYEVNLAGSMASAIKGKDRLKEFVESEFARAYEHGGVCCLEEFDAAHPTVATAVNNAIAGDCFHNDADGRSIPRHPDFRLIATANTLGTGATKEFNGRMKLDGATLDRFRMGRVFVGLDTELEFNILGSIMRGSTDATMRDFQRFYGEVQRLREFVASRDGFDALSSMRVTIDGAKAVKVGVPVDGLLASIGATWQADTRAQARVPQFDYAAWRA